MIARRDFINQTLRAGAAKSAAPRAFREHRFAAPRLARATLDVATHSSPRHQSINRSIARSLVDRVGPTRVADAPDVARASTRVRGARARARARPRRGARASDRDASDRDAVTSRSPARETSRSTRSDARARSKTARANDGRRRATRARAREGADGRTRRGTRTWTRRWRCWRRRRRWMRRSRTTR